MEATDFPLPRSPSLGECLEDWLERCSRRGLKVSTWRGYRTMASLYIPDELRQLPIDCVTTAHLDELYDKLLQKGRRNGRGLAPVTVRKVHIILHSTLARAVKRGWITANPALEAEPPPARACKPPMFPVWSPQELQRFLSYAQAHPYYAAFHLAATTGLRRGELLGLRWCDLDLENAFLQVLQTVIVVNAEVLIETPKSASSRRGVDLDARTVEVLRQHERVMTMAHASGSSPDLVDGNALVFSRRGGEPLHPTLFSYWFQRQVELAGLRRIRLHDLRHTHATLALQAGVHPKVVCERLGHSSITITLDTYSHVLPTMQRDAAEQVAALIKA
jgi:integrase